MAEVANFYGRTGFAHRLGNVTRDAGFGWNVAAIWNGDHDSIPQTPWEEGDLLISCHWPRLFPSDLLAAHPHGGLNLHPNLSLGYLVEDPVGRALENGRTMMSVACHRMEEEADSGDILAEHWRTIPEGSSREYAYELLRPLYESVLREALTKL